jgi:hypothetical protein
MENYYVTEKPNEDMMYAIMGKESMKGYPDYAHSYFLSKEKALEYLNKDNIDEDGDLKRQIGIFNPFFIVYYANKESSRQKKEHKITIIDRSNNTKYKYYYFDSIQDGIDKMIKLYNKHYAPLKISYSALLEYLYEQIKKKLKNYPEIKEHNDALKEISKIIKTHQKEIKDDKPLQTDLSKRKSIYYIQKVKNKELYNVYYYKDGEIVIVDTFDTRKKAEEEKDKLDKKRAAELAPAQAPAEEPAPAPVKKERKKKPPPARPKKKEEPKPAPKPAPTLSIRKKKNEKYYNVFDEKTGHILFSFDTKGAAIDKIKELEAPKDELLNFIESNKDALKKIRVIISKNEYSNQYDFLFTLLKRIKIVNDNPEYEYTFNPYTMFSSKVLKKAPAQAKPKKESKPKIAKPTKLQFVEGFQKLPHDEQIEILIKQLENYEPMPYTKTKELFNDLPKLLSMSPSKALPQILKYGITPDELRILYKSKVFDFFPTPNSCLDKLFKQLPAAFKKNNTMLEGTAGLGNVSYYFYNKGWDVTSNEYDPQLFKIMSRLLPKKIIKTNDDFFKLKYLDIDTLFLNPPFAKHIWVKFLLAGIKLLKESTTKSQLRSLMFISPAMNNAKGEKYLDWEYIVKPNGTVPRSAFKKYVEELLGHKVDVEKILAGEDEEFDENFKIFFGSQFDTCKGFGGTGMTAALSFFQVE